MNSLVTGGFGFLGSHLVELLLQDPDNSVTVVDSLVSNPLPINELNREIQRYDEIDFFESDIKSYLKYCPPNKFDVIFHLASVVGPAGVLKHGGKIARSIIENTLDMAKFAKENDSLFIDVSTSEIYGGGKEGFCSENGGCLVSSGSSARKEYAVGKLAAEIALQNDKNLKYKIIRPFNISGPRQSGKGGFVLPRFVIQAISGADLTVFDDGKQRRAFTDVRDIASGLVLLSQTGTHSVYNVGNPQNNCTINELAMHVLQITKSDSKIVHVDPKTIHGPEFVGAADKFPDAFRIISEGWKPKYSLEQTISDYQEWFLSLPAEISSSMAEEIGIEL